MYLLLWLSLLEIEVVTRDQILDETVNVSLSTNAIVKGMNPSVIWVDNKADWVL